MNRKEINRIKKTLLCFAGFLLISVWICDETLAQRGRGGGGGRSMSRGGHSMNRSRPASGRTPSMSRPTSRPTRPNTSRPNAGRPNTGRPGSTRPSTGLPSRPATPRPGTGGGTQRPGSGLPGRPAGRPAGGNYKNPWELNRPGSRPSTRPGGAAGDFLQNRPSTKPARPGNRPGTGQGPSTQPVRPGTRPNRPGAGDRPSTKPARPGNRPGRPSTLPARPGNRPGYRPPNHFPGYRPPGYRPPGYRPPGQRPPGYRPPGYRPPRPGHLPIYGPGYWGRPHWRWNWGYYPKNNWWAWASAGAITGWLAGSWANSTPVYYDYGTNIYYEGDQVYYDGEAISSAEDYATQAQKLASNVPDVDAEKVEWMPLGVFALSEDDGSAEDSTLFLQLAISKDGIIAGTFQNTETEKSFEVEGTIDQESQRAAWGPVGESWPIMETGIYNLTENEAGALVHFADGTTQQWSLFRMDEPDTP